MKRLRYYGGNYDTFVKVEKRAQGERGVRRARTSNKRAFRHLKNFIQKFGQGHKKMVKQAQCR